MTLQRVPFGLKFILIVLIKSSNIYGSESLFMCSGFTPRQGEDTEALEFHFRIRQHKIKNTCFVKMLELNQKGLRWGCCEESEDPKNRVHGLNDAKCVLFFSKAVIHSATQFWCKWSLLDISMQTKHKPCGWVVCNYRLVFSHCAVSYVLQVM